MSAKALLEARLLIAEHDKSKKTRKSASKKSNKENDDDKPTKKTETKKKRKSPTVQWTKPASHHLTDKLLTIIEAKARYKQAFGFDKGQARVDTGGKTIPELCSEIATKLFHVDGEDSEGEESKYKSDNLGSLTTCVKNRVHSLKTQYAEHHEKLGATGHGLVMGGNEEDIIEGSVIANAWDEIEKKFPWYKRMDALMGTSPVVNRTAVAHSSTRVDLSVLDRDGEAHTGPISINSDSSSEGTPVSDWGSSPAAKRRRTTAVDNADSDGSDADSVSIASSPPTRPKKQTPTTPSVRVKTEPSSVSASARGTKRKSTHEHVAEIAAQDRIQRVKLIELKEKAKTERTLAKYGAKNELELARMRHEQAESERRRQHDIEMMDRQIHLEAMRHGGGAMAPISRPFASVPGGPANGAPPQFYDPAFSQI